MSNTVLGIFQGHVLLIVIHHWGEGGGECSFSNESSYYLCWTQVEILSLMSPKINKRFSFNLINKRKFYITRQLLGIFSYFKQLLGCKVNFIRISQRSVKWYETGGLTPTAGEGMKPLLVAKSRQACTACCIVSPSTALRRAGITPLWPPFVVFVCRFIVTSPFPRYYTLILPSLSRCCCWVVSLCVIRFVLRHGNKRRLLPLLMISLRMFSGESGFLRWFRLFIFPFFCETYNVDIECSNKESVQFTCSFKRPIITL